MNQKKKFSKNDGANKVDEYYYKSLIGCLMYLTTTKPNIIIATVNQAIWLIKILSDLHVEQSKNREKMTLLQEGSNFKVPIALQKVMKPWDSSASFSFNPPDRRTT
ncbi:hypothetical protein CR513_29006, partial [Mucuna pruriens]